MATPKSKPTLKRTIAYTRPTTTMELTQFHADICSMARSVMRRKNADYGANDDPFNNFHRHGATGILVRMDDKLSRLTTFAQKGRLNVTEETVLDTAQDLINYAVLLVAYLGTPQKGKG